MYFPCPPLLFFEASLNLSEVGAAQAGLKHKPASLSDGSECSEGVTQDIWWSVEGFAPSLLNKVNVSCSSQSF